VGRRRRERAAPYLVDGGTAELVRDGTASAGWTLLLDGMPSSHVDLDDPTRLEFEYVRWLGDAVDLLAPAGTPLRVAHLGGGAATLARYVAATRPGSRQVVYEVDGALVELVRRRLPLRGVRGVKVRVLDARAGLAELPAGSQDVVVRDAFVGTAVPGHLMTAQCASEVVRVLRPGGAYLLNVADRAPFPMAAGELATLLSVFPQVALVTEPAILRGRRHGNLVLLASAVPLPLDRLARRVAAGAVQGRVRGTDAVRVMTGGRRPWYDGDALPEPEPPPGWGMD
jgi:spermidine synthase